MNRHERRRMVAKQGTQKAKVTFHQAPETLTKEHIAVMLSVFTHAFSIGSKLPGVTFPMHITIGFNGLDACGSVEPSDGSTEADYNMGTCH